MEVDAGIDITHQHRRTPSGNGVRLRSVDLPHVPLKRRETVRIGCRAVGKIALRRSRRVGRRRLLVGQLAHEGTGRRRTIDPAVLQDGVPERRTVRLRDYYADLRVAVDE